MVSLPTRQDLWLAKQLAGLLGRRPWFDIAVQQAINHNILGGMWFATALFLCWTQAIRKGQRDSEHRVLTMLIASALAISFVCLAGALISCPPPDRFPGLSGLFPDYLETNPNLSAFPSYSTALYSVVAAGIYSLHKTSGWLLWILVAFGVALPRMYVGGHFMTDVLVGLAIALVAYAATRRFIEAPVVAKIEPLLSQRRWLQWVADSLIFLWIIQVCVEFRDAIWLTRIFELATH